MQNLSLNSAHWIWCDGSFEYPGYAQPMFWLHKICTGSNFTLSMLIWLFVQTFSKECVPKKYFSYFSTKTFVVGTQNNCLNEHPKHMLKLIGKKLFTILTSNILFI